MPDRDRSDEIENARIGYQVAVNLVTYWGEANWSMFNAMIVANSVIVTGIALVVTSQYSLLRLLLPGIGFLFCVAWLLMIGRSHQFTKYYLMSAREIEEHYLALSVKTLSRGGLYSDGKPVASTIEGKERSLQTSLGTRFIRNEYVSYGVILAFVLVYFGILIELVK